jgi:hypothetical protein
MATCADSYESEGRALRAQLPERDHLLTGQDVILRYLKQFGITQWSKRPVTWTTVRRAVARLPVDAGDTVGSEL